MAMRNRPTPAGTWPLLISGALFLLTVPAVLLGSVVPVWLATTGALLFTGAAVAAVVWSYRVYQQHRETSARGVPIAGLIVGLIVVMMAGLVVVPAAMGG